MKLTAYIAEAFAVLTANRVRSILTALGLVIGVTAVIAIQVLGAGMSGAVGGLLGLLSDRTFFVVPNQRQADFTRAAIRLEDLQRIRFAVPNVVDAIPGGAAVREATFGHARRHVQIGAQADSRFATATPVAYGRKLSIEDIALGRHVCIVSGEAAQKLQMIGDQTGKTLRVGDRRYTIVGTAASCRRSPTSKSRFRIRSTSASTRAAAPSSERASWSTIPRRSPRPRATRWLGWRRSKRAASNTKPSTASRSRRRSTASSPA